MPDGRVAFTSDRLEVDSQFVQAAATGRAAEKRFRFASNCVRSGCKQWTGSRCGVIDTVMAEATEEQTTLPECSIRAECRWFLQSGNAACAVCPLVITDLRED